MHTLKDYYFLRFGESFFRKVKDLKNCLDPPPTWISRALDPRSRENFQRAIRRGGVDFFWNNPIWMRYLAQCQVCPLMEMAKYLILIVY